MKIKLYSARELDKKFPSGKWNGIEVIERHGNKAWWKYYHVLRFNYKRLARFWRKARLAQNPVIMTQNGLISAPVKEYWLDNGYVVPEQFVKKIKRSKTKFE